ncbi:MAG TPA: 16S rRNA (cytosine(1402)-N(4))-methyltransferase RsmH [Acidobacteriaceae bacterium]
MTERTRHVPVLLQTAIRMLNIRPGAVVVDATLGYAGHASEIARRLGAEGTLIGFDRDPEALKLAQERLDGLREELGAAMPGVMLHDVEFSRAKEALAGDGLLGRVDGLLADFGVSSMQLDEAHRGFSFQAEGPLDMRMNPREGVTAEQVVNQTGEKELADVIYEFGEERRSRRIARAIVRSRPVTTTAQLARIVAGAAGSMKGEKIHPATRTFQALRIYVNAELSEIEALLEAAPEVLKPGGRLVAISFHSLEDRRVKDALRDGAQKGIWEMLTRKPLTAEAEEQGLDRNPRARSAKLRAAERKGSEVMGNRV